MTEFTPFLSSIGGGLIGVSAVLLMLFLGRIAGISGILKAILPPIIEKKNSDILWRVSFVGGLILAPVFMVMVTGEEIPHVVSNDKVLMILGGLCVGIGTAIGSGCTSGHGVCGIPRFSLRSIIATVTFMSAGIVTVFVMRHMVGG